MRCYRLEAAHIIGFRKKGRYEASNGLLLRADWHTLFDLGLWAINPKGFRVELSANITDKEYRKFHGRGIRIPVDTDTLPISTLSGTDISDSSKSAEDNLLRCWMERGARRVYV
jgi:predicted restriction endonuclease